MHTFLTYQASDFSITSSLTKASRHWYRVTLEVLVGMGSVRYMKALYVVEVWSCHTINDLVANVIG